MDIWYETSSSHCDWQLQGDSSTRWAVQGDKSTLSSEGIPVRTNVGSLDVKNASLASQSFINTNSGTITVQNVKLERNMRMETNAGTISFSGSVNPGGDYSFETNAGTIDTNMRSNR